MGFTDHFLVCARGGAESSGLYCVPALPRRAKSASAPAMLCAQPCKGFESKGKVEKLVRSMPRHSKRERRTHSKRKTFLFATVMMSYWASSTAKHSLISSRLKNASSPALFHDCSCKSE